MKAKRHTFADVEALWHSVGVKPQLRAPEPAELVSDRYDGSVPVAEWLRIQAARAGVSPWRWRIAASIAIFTLGSLLAFAVKTAWIDRSAETELGEWKTITLADRTTVRVGPHTRLSFSFGDHHRSVHLSNGEAYFQVAKDAARPFVVETESLDVRAIGTVFAVQLNGADVVVTVKEGLVSVQRDPAAGHFPAPTAINLSRGEQVIVSSASPMVTRPVDLEQALAWTKGVLVMAAGDTVGSAARELNRRNREQLVIAEPALAARPLRGIFAVNDPMLFARQIASVTGSVVDLQDASVIRLVPAAEHAPDSMNQDNPSESHP